MSASGSIATEMRQQLRERRRVRAKLEDIAEQRLELLSYPKVSRYVKLHSDEQAARDELAQVESRIVELAELQEEVP